MIKLLVICLISSYCAADTVVLNQLMDQVLDSARIVINQGGLNELKIPDSDYEWKYRWHIVKLTGHVRCANGVARALSSIRRWVLIFHFLMSIIWKLRSWQPTGAAATSNVNLFRPEYQTQTLGNYFWNSVCRHKHTLFRYWQYCSIAITSVCFVTVNKLLVNLTEIWSAWYSCKWWINFGKLFSSNGRTCGSILSILSYQIVQHH